MTNKIELPTFCYVENPASEEPIKVVKGEMGYYILGGELKHKSLNELNASIGVTDDRIIDAMLAGSMFGWHVPGADPNNYDENGMFK